VKKKKDLEEITERLRKSNAGSQDGSDDKEDESRLGQLVGYQARLREEENRANGLFISLKDVKSRIAVYEKLPNKVSHTTPPRNDKLVELENKINELNKIYVDNGSSDKTLANTISKLRDQLKVKKTRFELESKMQINRIMKLKQNHRRSFLQKAKK